MSYLEYVETPVTVTVAGQSVPSGSLWAAVYECVCGHEGVEVLAPYRFPACEGCGQVVMPERERLEARREA